MRATGTLVDGAVWDRRHEELKLRRAPVVVERSGEQELGARRARAEVDLILYARIQAM
jgi:hypothetical protein